MKTVQDLVDGLNKIYATQGEYFIEYESCTGTLSLYYIKNNIRDNLAMFKPRYRTWSLWPSIGFQEIEAQHAIIDYLTNSNPSDWFAEKKYYIAVGMYDKTSKIVYYKNGNELDFKLRTMIDFDEKHLQEDDIFTENEIEQLKSTLPTNMAKIVDLGKVEVKDD